MKKTKFFLGALSLLAFAACSDDKNVDAPQQVLNDGSESYITVRIMDAFARGGRAESEPRTSSDFNNGGTVTQGNTTYDESAIKSLKIAFYDSNKNFITFGEANELDFSTPNQTGASVETIQEVEVKLTLKPNDPTPAYAIAFANPIASNPSLSNISATQTDPRNTWGTNTQDGENTTYLFAMNNSVYFNHPAHELQVAVPVTAENFYKSTSTASEKTAAKAVDFYIERIAGKVTLHGPTGNNNTIPVDNYEASINEGTTTSSKILVFVPEKWGLNATEKKTNLMKNFTTPFNTLNANLTWGSVADASNGCTLWNDAPNHRSYWAHSVSWNDDNFPDVSDDVKTSETYNLNYVSYKSIADNGATIGNCQYTLENTKKQASFRKNSALVSAVIIGHYEIRDKNASGTSTTPVSFYRKGSSIYTEEGYWAAMAGLQKLIVKGQITGEGESQTLNVTSLTATELKSITKIVHPEKSSFGDKVAENLVTLALSETANLDSYYIRDTDDKYKKYTDVKTYWTETKINQELLGIFGLTEAYTDGKAYFSVPIRHLGITTKDSEGKDNFTAGYYGIVRNHTYDMEISKIKNTALATGVFNDSQPIVPTTITDEFSFVANLKVNAWRMVKKTYVLGE